MPAAARPSPDQALRDGLQQDTGLLLQPGGADGTVRSVTVNRGATAVVMFITSGHERAECHPGQPLEVNVAAGPCEHANTPVHSHSTIAYLGRYLP